MTNATVHQSTANERYVKRQVSVVRVYMCSERHLSFRRNIDMRRQWSVGNIGWNEWLSWEMVINDHCLGSVPPCLTIRVLSYSKCKRSTHSISKWIFRNLALRFNLTVGVLSFYQHCSSLLEKVVIFYATSSQFLLNTIYLNHVQDPKWYEIPLAHICTVINP